MEELDGLIHVLNQYRADPEARLEDYLKRCYANWAKENEAKQLEALGYVEGMKVIRLGADPVE